MPIDHKVTRQESLSSIAARYGLLTDKIWLDQANQALRDKRGNGDVLFSGDQVRIPDPDARTEAGATDARHTFRRLGVPALLRLRVMIDDDPRSNERFVLEVDGQTIEGALDGDGYLEVPVPPTATRATLRLGDKPEVFELELGDIEPIDETKGLQGRLRNLCLYDGEVDGDAGPMTEEAIRRFQKWQGMTETGVVDDEVKARLLDLHGG